MSARAANPYGPSALGSDFRRFVELTMTLARSEFKVRYYGSALGYLWSLMRPLLFFGVLYLFFTEILDVGKGIPHYGVYLLGSVVLWNYFGETTSNAVTCLVTREALLRKIRFPRLVIPLSVSVTATFNLAMNLLTVFIFALANGVSPKLSWLGLIPVVLAFIVLATGIGMLLSAAYVRFRDVAPIWEVLVQAWFYCSPIMYTAARFNQLRVLRMFGHNLPQFAMANPAALLLTEMGHVLIGGPAFPTAVRAGGWPSTIIASAIIVALFLVGSWFFAREAPRVAENL